MSSMSMSRSRTWTLGTAIVLLVVFALGWFLMISPKRSQAAELQATTESAVAQNQITEGKIRQLKLEQRDLPSKQAQIAAIAQQLPEQPQLPSLFRQLLEASGASDVAILNVAPQALVPMPSDPGVSYIPVKVKVRGNFTALKRYLFALEENKRAVLVTGFDIGKADASSDATEIVLPDDLSMSIDLRVFVSGTAPSTTATAPTAAGAGGATQPPGASDSAATPTASATAPAAPAN